jgi:ubiquinone/menaquinone biosynthesis C-methylase UbiE
MKMAAKKSWGHINKERLKIIINHCGEKILDIGCGRGEYVDYLNKSGRFAVGIDLLDTLILQSKNKKNLMIGDGNLLPFKNGSFDTVLLFEVLEHVMDEKNVLIEASRVMKKNIILSVPYGPEPDIFEYTGVTWHHQTDPTHKRTYDEESLRITMKKAGFNVKKIMKINPIRPETLVLDSWYAPQRLALLIGHFFNKLPIRRKYYMTLVAIGEKNE